MITTRLGGETNFHTSLLFWFSESFGSWFSVILFWVDFGARSSHEMMRMFGSSSFGRWNSVGIAMPLAPCPIHHHFYGWYVYHQKWVVCYCYTHITLCSCKSVDVSNLCGEISTWNDGSEQIEDSSHNGVGYAKPGSGEAQVEGYVKSLILNSWL